MIASRRRTHRLLVAALALVLPIVLYIAVQARPSRARIGDVPAVLRENTGTLPSGAWERADFFADLAITVRGAGEAVELELHAPLSRPDVLVYWTASQTVTQLADDAYLIGRLGGAGSHVFALPRGTQGGQLVLYSLGHQEVLAAGSLSPDGTRK